MLTLEGKIVDLEAFMCALGRGDDGSIADQRIMDTRVRDQVGLEFVEIDVERAIKSKG